MPSPRTGGAKESVCGSQYQGNLALGQRREISSQKLKYVISKSKDKRVILFLWILVLEDIALLAHHLSYPLLSSLLFLSLSLSLCVCLRFLLAPITKRHSILIKQNTLPQVLYNFPVPRIRRPAQSRLTSTDIYQVRMAVQKP